MSAEIIPFPGKRARPLEANELPEHWPEKLRQHYLYVTYDGYNSHEDGRPERTVPRSRLDESWSRCPAR